MADVEANVEMPAEQPAPSEPTPEEEQPAAEEEQPAAAVEAAPAGEEEEPKTQAKAKRAAKKATQPTPATDGPASARSRRERKPVEFFQPSTTEKEEHFVIQQAQQGADDGWGKGSKLRDIPNVAFKLGKVTGKDELAEQLHQVLYRRKGAAATRKRDILDFSGFAFEEEEQEKELKYRREALGKWKLDLLHRLMDTLDLSRGSGDKAAKVERVLEFLQEPTQLSEVNLAEKEAEKKEKAKAKKEREAAKKEKEKAKKEKEKAKKEKEKAKKEKASASKRKASAEKKARPSKKAKKEESESEPEEEEEEEAMAEAESDPAAALSGEQLRGDIEAELGQMASEELKAVNVRLLLGKLSKKYGFDVKSRKAEIRAMAVEYCNQRLGEAEGEVEGAGAEPAPAEGGAEAAAAEEEQPQEEEAAAKGEPEAQPAAAEEEQPAAGADAEMAEGTTAEPEAPEVEPVADEEAVATAEPTEGV